MKVSIATTIAAATSLALAGSAFAASITGTVTYDGKVPSLKPIAMNADPACAQKHSGPVPNEMLVLGEGNAMANIFVRVTNPPAGDHPVPSEPVVMDQKGCIYDPHVFAVRAGQPLKMLNSDGIMHNVHALPATNKPFNMAMPPSRTEATETFEKPEDPFKIKCDVHPWMNAYVAVMSHPFYAVTGTDGKFEIADLPAGTYTLEAWHEKLGTTTQEVTVGADESKTADFKLSPPK